MGAIVYGSFMEGGWMELDDETFCVECPRCGSADAVRHVWEACEAGCINEYKSLYCEACGYREGDSLHPESDPGPDREADYEPDYDEEP
jgi:C4-type Zn-finger protein